MYSPRLSDKKKKRTPEWVRFDNDDETPFDEIESPRGEASSYHQEWANVEMIYGSPLAVSLHNGRPPTNIVCEEQEVVTPWSIPQQQQPTPRSAQHNSPPAEAFRDEPAIFGGGLTPKSNNSSSSSSSKSSKPSPATACFPTPTLCHNNKESKYEDVEYGAKPFPKAPTWEPTETSQDGDYEEDDDDDEYYTIVCCPGIPNWILWTIVVFLLVLVVFIFGLFLAPMVKGEPVSSLFSSNNGNQAPPSVAPIESATFAPQMASWNPPAAAPLSPTASPSSSPTASPSASPSSSPTASPSITPETDSPTVSPAPSVPKTLAPTFLGTPPSNLTVGAYYYPWYGNDFHSGDGYVRSQLSPPQLPALGEYNDADPATVAQHLRWSQQANIHMWITSWWGAGRREDVTTRDIILNHADLQTHKIALLYETTGRIKASENYTTQRVADDIDYICTTYFDHPNYYRIDGRPVLFVYLTRKLERTGVMEEVILLMKSVASFHGYDLYLVGDHVWDKAPPADGDLFRPFLYLDAMTNYDVYGSMGKRGYAGQDGVDDYYEEQRQWKERAGEKKCGFIPAVSPGFNDRGVRLEANHLPLYRRLHQDADAGSLFRAAVERARFLVDPAYANSLLIVNSFNEWHEDTQIEPVGGVNTVDPFPLTTGGEYVAYGELYLNILRDGTMDAVPTNPPVLLPAAPTNPPVVPPTNPPTFAPPPTTPPAPTTVPPVPPPPPTLAPIDTPVPVAVVTTFAPVKNPFGPPTNPPTIATINSDSDVLSTFVPVSIDEEVVVVASGPL